MRRLLIAITAAVVLVGASFAMAGSAGGPPKVGNALPPHHDKDVCAAPGPDVAQCAAKVLTDAGDPAPLATSTYQNGYGPSQLQTAYGLPAGSGSPTVAIVDAYDNPNAATDLAAYRQQFGLSPCGAGCFTKVNQTGGSAMPSGNVGWGQEIDLDIEMVSAICPNCKILLVESTNNSFVNLLAAEDYATSNANYVSNSWAGGEFSQETSAAYDGHFNKPGVAITVSSGDSGYGVEYPGASPYVTAVGGTSLLLNADNTRKSETVWNGAGSGCSAYEPKPAWQTDTGCVQRTVADISAVADPSTGVAVYDSYGSSGGSNWYVFGGTSVSSPIIASVYALAGNTAGASTAYGHSSALYDVTSGSNANSCSPPYLCTGGPGYDGPTGLGTPNGLVAFGGPATPADFSLSVTPSSQTVNQGTSAGYTVAMTPNSAFTDSVDVVVGAPSGVTKTPGCSLTVSSPSCIVTASSTTAGSYTLTFTGTAHTNSALSHSTSATLQVNTPPPADYSLSISPSKQNLRTPGSTTYAITVNKLNGFTGAVNLSVSGLPNGLTTGFSPNPATSTSTLTVSATTRLGRKNYNFKVTGTSGTLTHSVNATLALS